MDNNITKEMISKIILRIDSLKDDELNNEFIRLNNFSRDDFKKKFLEAVNSSPDERHDMIYSSIHKLLLKKNPPISSMLLYIKTIATLLVSINNTLIKNDKDDSYTINLIDTKIKLSFLKQLINSLVLDIEKGYSTIITVDFDNSKEILLKEFDDLLSTELPKSSIYQKRKQIRLQNIKKLRQYLKVWELRNIGLRFDDIARLINENTSTVKKQYFKAFELIYDCKYSKEKYIEFVIAPDDKQFCAECPKNNSKDGKECKETCEKVEKYLSAGEKYQRENLYGLSYENNADKEIDDNFNE